MGVLVACYRLRVSGYEFATSYKLQDPGYGLQVTGSGFAGVVGSGLQVLAAGYGL